MSSVRDVCRKYFILIRFPGEMRDKTHKALSAAAILSCFTVIIPAAFGAVYGIAEIAHKFKNRGSHSGVQKVASEVLAKKDASGSSSVSPRAARLEQIPDYLTLSSSSSSSETLQASQEESTEEVRDLSADAEKKTFQQTLESTSSEMMGPLFVEENREALMALSENRHARLTLSSLLRAARHMDKPTENKLLIDLIARGADQIYDLIWYDNLVPQLRNFFFVLPEQAQVQLLAQNRFFKEFGDEQKKAILEMPENAALPQVALKAFLTFGPFNRGGEEVKWVGNLSESLWENAVAESSEETINKFVFIRGNQIVQLFPDRALSIIRGTLKNPHVTPRNQSLYVTICAMHDPKNPAKLVREIGAEYLRQFPWNEPIAASDDLGNSLPTFIEVILPELDMNDENDVAILLAAVPSLHFGRIAEERRTGLLNSLNPAQREKLDAEITRLAKIQFKDPQKLAELNTAEEILKAGRLLQKEDIDTAFLRKFVTAFAEQPVEKVRAMEQLFAEKRVVIEANTFDYEECRKDEMYPIQLPKLVEKLDDPFLLMPLLGELTGLRQGWYPHIRKGLAREIWHKDATHSQGIYTAIMTAFEEKPWKLALRLEDNDTFDLHSFTNWVAPYLSSKPANLNIPNLKKWEKWLIKLDDQFIVNILNLLNLAEMFPGDDAFDDLRKELENNPEAKEVFTAAIMGPTPETVAHRINDYSATQLLAALATEEGKAKLKPLEPALLQNEKLTQEFRDWIAKVLV